MIRTVLFCSLTILMMSTFANAQPELSSWMRNTTGLTGYNSLPANVQQVRYSANYVYISSSGIPAYSIGPWPGNPNTPSNQNYLMRFSRNPVVNNGTKTATSLGPIGLWVNGVPVFNSLDAMSYNNQNIWHQNAVVVEAPSFDACFGHPAGGGVYHHHQNPKCLYDYSDTTVHSPVLGFSFDGFPIYGAYAYSGTEGAGVIRRMQSSYRTRNITQRTTLPNGTVLSPSQYGPNVSGTYPLGYYAEDYEYVAGLGDLDAYNGRFAVTPEYPEGTYAYYVTISNTGSSAYPYAIGPNYYGVVTTDNITSHGHVTIGETVTIYDPTPPSIPLLVSPANGSTTSLSVINLFWNQTLYATSYYLQVASDSLFTTLLVNDSTLTDTTFSVSSQNVAAVNYWRVCAKNSYGTSAWSDVRKFTVTGWYHWQIVSLSKRVADSSLATLFPSAVAGAYRYVAGPGYVQSGTLESGAGYWVKVLGSFNPSFVGDSIVIDTIDIVTGWNLIGSISSPVAVSSVTSTNPGIILSNFFGYNGTYVITNDINPGYGYWVKSNQAGSIILSSSVNTSGYNVQMVPSTEEPPSLPSVEEQRATTPKEFHLDQNYPNPFNPSTTIRYKLDQAGYVSLSIYSLLGEKIADLVQGIQGSGLHTIIWDAGSFPSGIYICRLTTELFTESGKMVLIR